MFGKKRDDIHKTPDVSHIQNPHVTHEESDIRVDSILKFVVGLTLFLLIGFGLMFGLSRLLERREKSRDERPGPMARSESERLPPAGVPRLQDAPGFGVDLPESQGRVPLENQPPQSEYQKLRSVWDDELRNGIKDPKTGQTIAQPIDQAINQFVQGQASGGGQATSGQAPSNFQVPTYQSSGRATEKRIE